MAYLWLVSLRRPTVSGSPIWSNPHVRKLSNNDLVIVECWIRWIMIILLHTFLGVLPPWLSRGVVGLDAVSRLREATKGVVLLTPYFQIIIKLETCWNQTGETKYSASFPAFERDLLSKNFCGCSFKSFFFFDQGNFGGWALPWIMAPLIESCADWVKLEYDTFLFLFFLRVLFIGLVLLLISKICQLSLSLFLVHDPQSPRPWS